MFQLETFGEGGTFIPPKKFNAMNLEHVSEGDNVGNGPHYEDPSDLPPPPAEHEAPGARGSSAAQNEGHSPNTHFNFLSQQDKHVKLSNQQSLISPDTMARPYMGGGNFLDVLHRLEHTERSINGLGGDVSLIKVVIF